MNHKNPDPSCKLELINTEEDNFLSEGKVRSQEKGSGSGKARPIKPPPAPEPEKATPVSQKKPNT
ncbi:MAG: hypothetical protein CMH23_02700 [Methylophaga sp.]|jgi:hypothetical protein|uniref:hypothetical protein n=1 Tax=Methylophaga sp. TaxID=2024840 RepID=UPI000C96E547|nr:hypothetical protein [Methylophaga sp.]MBN45362.1 hypothetical protein [Methylophaga sp.]|tara:strand:+ start:61853 stop:62047 length:195 start_codon:yes stop_codon:yes gene_type:complete